MYGYQLDIYRNKGCLDYTNNICYAKEKYYVCRKHLFILSINNVHACLTPYAGPNSTSMYYCHINNQSYYRHY